MLERSAQARWEGSIGDGKGTMKMSNWEGAYSVPSRFDNDEGTNPEELIAAAHAGCFSMALSGGLTRAGHPPTYIETTATVQIEKLDAGWRITHIELATEAKVEGMDDAEFQTAALNAKESCPISAALASVPEITLKATLV